MRLKEALYAMRPLNCLLAAIAVFIGASISQSSFAFEWNVLFAMIAAFFICGGGQSINDYFDFELDQKKQKNKYASITSQNKKQLLGIALIFFIIGNAFAFLINHWTIGIALGITILLIVYSWLLTKRKYIGNLVIALGTALPLVFGAAVFVEFKVVIWLAAGAFLVNWAREIVKDVEDIKADQGQKTTLPMILKTKPLLLFVGILLAIAIVIVYVPIKLAIFGNIYFLVLVTIANALFIKAFLELHAYKPSNSQKTFKIAMALALLGFLVGIL
ncbi:UbiA family prenyltransferase [Candidatus Micrarchaeota archaeon]|nr:UbiA family prenyltransferase [Candidatus Micrarchaeota archaeon]MBU1930843.1 UbiA family prenyltransferase [Candidatus Micrarchaeota archaeon]